jgi:hypothetical protein
LCGSSLEGRGEEWRRAGQEEETREARRLRERMKEKVKTWRREIKVKGKWRKEEITVILRKRDYELASGVGKTR